MGEKSRAEISPQKRSLKLAPMLGDWTTYKPPRTLVKKIKIGLYGFDRLSGEELKQAHIMHYNFAQELCHKLKTKLRLGIELFSVDAFQNTYANFIKNFTAPIFQGKFKASNYHDEIFVAFDLNVVDSIINSALGSQDTYKLNRGLTEAENMILNEVLQEHLASFADIFKGILQNELFEKVTSPNIQADNSLTQQSTFVYFTMEVNINDSIGKIVFGYNGFFLKNLLKKMNQTGKKSPLQINKLPSSIFGLVDIPVSVSIGKTNLVMNEINSLEVGDVVSFDQNIENAIQINLSEGHTIMGQIGKRNGKFVVKVVAIEKDKNLKIAPPVIEEQEDELSSDLKDDFSTENDNEKLDSFDTIDKEEGSLEDFPADNLKQDAFESENPEEDLESFEEEPIEDFGAEEYKEEK